MVRKFFLTPKNMPDVTSFGKLLVEAFIKFLQRFSQQYRCKLILGIQPKVVFCGVLFLKLSVSVLKNIHDTRLRFFVSVFWKLMIWTDDFLQWDPAEYGGIESKNNNLIFNIIYSIHISTDIKGKLVV